MKKFFINFIVKRLFKALTDEDVFKVIGNNLYVCGDLCGDDEKKRYHDEAVKALNNRILNEIDNKIVLEANKLMFERSKSIDDLFFGKAILYSVNLRKEYLKILSKLK